MADQAPPPPPPPPARTRPDWGRRLLLAAIALVVIVLTALAASAIVPRWWAQRIGDQVGGSMFAGFGLGLLYGLVFTALSLTVLWYTFHRRRPWKVWAAGLVLALVVALPNLMTLAIVLGTGNAAHAGERILDVEAPLFRGFSLVGALLAVAAVGFWRYQRFSHVRTRRQNTRLRHDLDAARTPPPADAGEGDPK